MIIQPPTVPHMLPIPPEMAVPPSTAAEMASMDKSVPKSDMPAFMRAARIKPEIPAKKPLNVYVQILTALTLIPATLAASVFPPMHFT